MPRGDDMWDLVKEAAISVQQLPPPASPLDDEGLRWMLGGLCALFLTLFSGMGAYIWGVRKEVDEQIADAIKASEDKMGGSIMTNAGRNAETAAQFLRAKDEIWGKLDEFNVARIKDARNLVTRDDLAALEARIDKRIEDARNDSRQDRRDVIAPLESSLAEVRRMLMEQPGRRT